MPRIDWATKPRPTSRRTGYLRPAGHGSSAAAMPTPIALGEPGHDYPFRWAVHEWLPGSERESHPIADLEQAAVDLAGFVCAFEDWGCGRCAQLQKPGREGRPAGATGRARPQTRMVELDGKAGHLAAMLRSWEQVAGGGCLGRPRRAAARRPPAWQPPVRRLFPRRRDGGQGGLTAGDPPSTLVPVERASSAGRAAAPASMRSVSMRRPGSRARRWVPSRWCRLRCRVLKGTPTPASLRRPSPAVDAALAQVPAPPIGGGPRRGRPGPRPRPAPRIQTGVPHELPEHLRRPTLPLGTVSIYARAAENRPRDRSPPRSAGAARDRQSHRRASPAARRGAPRARSTTPPRRSFASIAPSARRLEAQRR